MRTSTMTWKSAISKIVTALIVGTIAGASAGALILGGLGWFIEGSVTSGDESRWTYLGLYQGARLGLVLGATLGTLAGLLWIIYSHHRQSKAMG